MISEADFAPAEAPLPGALRRRMAAFCGIAIFLVAPFLVFHRTIEDATISDFRFELGYVVTGWGPWALIVAGSLCMVPVAFSIGRSAFSRWSLNPGVRRAYEAWGITLYLLGVLLAVQTSQIASAF